MYSGITMQGNCGDSGSVSGKAKFYMAVKIQRHHDFHTRSYHLPPKRIREVIEIVDKERDEMVR